MTYEEAIRAAFVDELQKIGEASQKKQAGAIGKALKAMSTGRGEHLNEVAGLGVLAVPGLDTLQAKLRSHGDPEEYEKKRLLGEGAHAALDVGGLGLLAVPSAYHAFKGASVKDAGFMDSLGKALPKLFGSANKAAPAMGAVNKAVGAAGTLANAVKKVPPKPLTDPNDLMAGFHGVVKKAPMVGQGLGRMTSNARQGALRAQGWHG